MPLLAVEIAEVAQLVGDPARANMLAALLDRRALTASELAATAGVMPQTASSHLAKLATANLLRVEKQGRHRYYRLASPAVAQMLESVMNVAALTPPRIRPASKLDDDMRTARSCYDHIAGRLGVAIADALASRDLVVIDDDGAEVTAAGLDHLAALGIALPVTGSQRRVLCRPCLDWSERRFHLAGRVGAAILHHCLDRKWLQRRAQSRALTVTRTGRGSLIDAFRLDASMI